MEINKGKVKILVIGSNGLIGQKVCELIIINKNIELIAASKSANKLPLVEPFFHYLDISNEFEIGRFICAHKPSVIINCAAITQVDDCERDKDNCWKINVDAVQFICIYAKQYNIRLVHLSSDFVFDGISGLYVEEDETNPVSFYGLSKLEAEKIISAELEDYVIVRTILVYGISHFMTRSNLMLWVKDSLEAGKTINVVNDQYRMPTLVEDIAKGTLELALSEFSGIYHISGDELMSVFEIANRTAEFFNLDTSLILPTSSASLNQIGRRPAKTGFNLNKARAHLKYSPRSLEEGLLLLSQQIDAFNANYKK